VSYCLTCILRSLQTRLTSRPVAASGCLRMLSSRPTGTDVGPVQSYPEGISSLLHTKLPNSPRVYDDLHRTHQNSKPSSPSKLPPSEVSAPSDSDLEPAVDAVFAAAAVSFAAVCVVIAASLIAVFAVSVGLYRQPDRVGCCQPLL
jgi:hypothetical protein